MNDNRLDYIYNMIIDLEIAEPHEITLVCNINGWNEETLNSIIYARTGYHDIEQYIECEEIEL